MSSFSVLVSTSANGGIPFPPSLIIPVTLPSFTALPLASFSCLNKPFRPGPIFRSVLSALWQTEQLSSKVDLPLAASAANTCAAVRIPMAPIAICDVFMPSSLQSRHMGLQAGERAPEIKTGSFQLSKLKGKTVVLFFFPKADTPGCTKESCEFRDSSKKFAKKNAEIVGLSPDKAEAQAKFAAKYGLPYTFVPDPDHAIAEAYGVWKEKSMYGRKYMGIERTTFVVDPQGKIATIFPKVSVTGHVEAVLESIA